MKKKRQRKKRDAGAMEASTPLRTKVGTVLVGLLIVLVLGGAIATCYQRSTSTGPYRGDYEGQVSDKYVTNHESQQGTWVTKNLLVKSNTGEQFQVVVSSAIFERAQVGMRIRRKGTSIELSADGQDWK
jgi:hypothetical protein